MNDFLPPNIEVCSLTNEIDKLDPKKLETTKNSLLDILSKFLQDRDIATDDIKIKDCFYFIFDSCPFHEWKRNDWWDQREILKEIRNNSIYRDRTIALLKHSEYSEHYTYRVGKVPDQDDPVDQYASRRERLFLKEGYDNVIDSISHAAFYHNKYREAYGGMLELLFIYDQTEEIIIVDNGTGKIFHKPYRRITPWRILFKAYKLIMNWGAYYVGGMHLGLKVTYGKLSCYGDGAVVTQTPFKQIY